MLRADRSTRLLLLDPECTTQVNRGGAARFVSCTFYHADIRACTVRYSSTPYCTVLEYCNMSGGWSYL